jgi:hypothetical protein
MYSSNIESISLPVEVSGWDDRGSFFVEHATLDCTESGCKVLALRRSVSCRSLVFLRTLYSGSVAKSYPEAYRVESIESTEGSGFKYLHLENFLPRRSRECEPKDLTKHLISVREEVKS